MLRRLRYLIISLSFVLLSSLAVVAPASATFSSHKLMADSVFSSYGSMNAAQIDGFLNSFPSSCISPNKKFKAIDVTGYSPSTGYKYGNSVSAGTIIYHAAQAYHLNPKVILTTLQKEQSLVSGTAGCSTLRYTGAMGYGCPDGGHTYNYSNVNLYTINNSTVRSVSGTCVNSSSKAGFSQQVIHGTWLLKFGQQRSLGNVNWAEVHGNWDNSDDPPTTYGGPMTQGYRARVKGGSSTYYDGYTNIDGSSVHMDTGATATLYWYTPHFHGNQSFVSIYEGWFGSTLKNEAVIPHPDGTLVRAEGDSEVFLIENGKRRSLVSKPVFLSYGYKFGDVKPATVGDLDYPEGTPLQFREGTLVKGSADTVYIIDSSGGVATKRSLVSKENFVRLGYNFNEVIIAANSELPPTTGTDIAEDSTTHPDGTMVRAENDPTVYFLESGKRRSLTSAYVLKSHGLNMANVKLATAGDTSLPTGAAIDFREGVPVKGSSATVYVVDYDGSGINKRSIGTYQNFVGLGYSFTQVMNLPNSELPARNGTTL